MSADFNYLKTHFSKIFNSMVREHQAVNKVITFCNNKEQYFLFTGMFNEVNGGKGITEDLEVSQKLFATLLGSWIHNPPLPLRRQFF